MTTLLLVAFLAQSPTAASNSPPEPDTTATASDLTHAQSSSTPAERPHETWPVDATKRFLGALTGGIAGAAIPVAIVLAANTCSVMSFGGGCIGATAWNLFSAILGPITVTVGSLIGHWIAGGEVSVGTAIAGLLGGLSLGAFFTVLHSGLIPTANDQIVPVLIASTAIGIVLQAIALESRTEALADTPAIAAPTNRFVLDVLATAGVITLGGFISLLVGASTGGGGAVITALLLSTVAPLVPWAIHRSLGGRGSAAWAYLGLLVSAATAVVAFGGAVLTAVGGVTPDARSLSAFGSLVVVGSLVSIFGIPLMLEFGHGQEVRRGGGEDARVSAGIAPLVSPSGVSGGALSLTGTF